jgi:hypothetical protein
MQDGEAFRKFLLEEMGKITNGPEYGVRLYYAGKANVPLGRIVYDVIRCGLMHEAQLPKSVVFTPPEPGPGRPFGGADGKRYDGKLMNRVALNEVFGFPLGWIWNMIRVVAEAPENKDEFADGTYPVPDGYSTDAGLVLEYPDEHPERFPPNAPLL